jgi:hypothetical protein
VSLFQMLRYFSSMHMDWIIEEGFQIWSDSEWLLTAVRAVLEKAVQRYM